MGAQGYLPLFSKFQACLGYIKLNLRKPKFIFLYLFVSLFCSLFSFAVLGIKHKPRPACHGLYRNCASSSAFSRRSLAHSYQGVCFWLWVPLDCELTGRMLCQRALNLLSMSFQQQSSVRRTLLLGINLSFYLLYFVQMNILYFQFCFKRDFCSEPQTVFKLRLLPSASPGFYQDYQSVLPHLAFLSV